MGFPISLIIGSVTLEATQRLPASAFTANLRKVMNANRSQNGNLYTNTLHKKYSVNISGIAQTLFPELQYEYERDDSIDLYMIVNRIERLNPSGLTNTFVVSRRFRLDDDYLTPVVEYPIGTQIPGTSVTGLTNTTNNVGRFTLTFIPTAGTQTLLVKYYPIISGTIVEFNSDYDWTQDEVTWSLLFEEL